MQLLLLALVPLALAAPLLQRDSPAPTAASAATLATYVSPARFSRDAYCANLTVGARVGADGQVLWLAGDGGKTQRVYVAHSPSRGIVVAHQGTNSSSFYSLLNDSDVARDARDARLEFLGSDASVLGGFQAAWLDTADAVLAQVQAALASYPGSRVLVTGHSLGASIALLDAARLRHETGAEVDTVLFGLPRSGNDAFADGIDAVLPAQRHLSHYRDPIPHLPGKTFGYQAPSGEVWLDESGSNGVDCGDQENDRCSNSVHFWQYERDDHKGPYVGVTMGCRA